MKRLSSPSSKNGAAFSLIELLVVIAIIAFLATLVAGLATRSSEKKVNARAAILIKDVELAIDGYKDKMGFLPPDNPDNPGRPPLYYSLKGTLRDDAGTRFTLHPGEPDEVQKMDTEIETVLGIRGIINSATSVNAIKDFAPNLKESHVEKDGNGFRFIVMPYKGPEGDFNPVHYDASSPGRHNANGYDLWVEVVIANKTNIIGNW